MKNKKYILGVDGGNTKTDYFLFDLRGDLVGHIREGTCSHEQFKNGYQGAYEEIKKCIDKLLQNAKCTVADIEVGVFGLAGLDTEQQKEKMRSVIKRIGIKKYVADNDGYLGIKAGSKNGVGICCINGTGTVTVGIDRVGSRLQVGGVGYISGDDGGGAFITRELFREVYNVIYKCGKDNSIVDTVFKLLGIETKEEFIHGIHQLYESRFSHTPFVKLVFEQSENANDIAVRIINKMTEELAKSTAGCMEKLDFTNQKKIEIILAGSIWTKVKQPILIERYTYYLSQYTQKEYEIKILQEPPGIGAILWGLEIINGKAIDELTKQKVIKSTEGIYIL